MFSKSIQHKKLRLELSENRDRLYKLAFAWTNDAMLADDLVQETLQKAMQSLGNLREHAKLMPWACRILRNCHHDWLRRHREHGDIEDFEIAGSVDPEQDYLQQDTSRLVRDAIARLPQKHRDVITLVDLMEFSYQEVSTALDIPIGTVMSRLCRARAQLRDRLKVHVEQSSTASPTQLRRVK
ncbi:MAG: sigma-70 family RNA polymerase sigma factor [Gammaproteobacteria bacterium]|nr:sigma-70 family RNA polymerase sigma factor [Gammaproteobacteria bacterium]